MIRDIFRGSKFVAMQSNFCRRHDFSDQPAAEKTSRQKTHLYRSWPPVEIVDNASEKKLIFCRNTYVVETLDARQCRASTYLMLLIRACLTAR